MATVKREDIVGVVIGSGQTHCAECNNEDYSNLKLENILVIEDVEDSDEIIFCDQCGNSIS